MTVLKIENIGAVTLFTIDNAAKRNVISNATAVDLQRAFKAFDADERQRVAVITGAGTDAFTAGADFRDVPEFWRCTPGSGFHTDKPIISAVSGYCIGGGMTLVMMSDLAVAAQNSSFHYPEARLGLSQGFISALVARIPHKNAMEIAILGRKLTAQRAYEIGLVNDVTPVGGHLEAALAMANQIAASAPMVVQTLKRFVGQTLPSCPSEHYARALRDIEAIRTSADCQEGLKAFTQKREPQFIGR